MSGRPRAYLNIAGIYPRTTLLGFEPSDFRTVFDVNVLGTLLVAKSFVQQRATEQQCAIINIASTDAHTPSPNQLLYSASKAAVINLTKSMADELAPYGVRVNAIAPDDIGTERLRQLRGGKLGHNTAEPMHVAELCWALAGQSPLPLLNGETITAKASILDTAWPDQLNKPDAM